MKSELIHALEKAYDSHAAGMDIFSVHANDATFLEAAQAEHDRLSAVEATLGCPLSMRCTASAKHLSFLKHALAQHETPQQPKEDEQMTSKLKGLASLAKSTIAEVEGRATNAMDKLAKAQAHAHSGLDKVDGVTAEIEKAATDMEDFASQVTNGPPE